MSVAAHAHLGQLEANGCHFDKKTGVRHCHRSAASQANDDKKKASIVDRKGAFANCAAARAAGAAPVRRGEPGYGPRLDRDDDGIGCE